MLISACPEDTKIHQISFSRLIKIYSGEYIPKKCQHISRDFPKRLPKPFEMGGVEPGKSTSNKNSLPGLVFGFKMSPKSVENDSPKASKSVINLVPDHENPKESVKQALPSHAGAIYNAPEGVGPQIHEFLMLL